mmetsp:Transcript_1648/g.2635  ORF Transcript_1648/g.2635 Transcript_1648/m.2635 type:complete len:589 (+) Transcript_1648:1216-2982(+)
MEQQVGKSNPLVPIQRCTVFLVLLVVIFHLIFDRFEIMPIENKANDFELRNRYLREEVSFDLNTAKLQSKKLLSLIRNRYELNTTIGSNFFLASNNIGKHAWDILKYKFALKMTAKQNQTFLMIFGGSSVTAGHDNYYNESYPYIVKKRMSPILSALGIELIVRNIALGANNCAPYILCYESMGGMDPDFVGWEQSYNCGHDEPVFETATRIATWSANKAMVYYSASGAWTPSDCPPSTDSPPYCSEDWTPSAAGLPEWDPSLADIMAERDLLNKFNEDHSSAARFSGSFNREYSGIGIHGFNVWEKNKHCTFVNEKTKLTESGCNGIDSVQKCALRFMTKEAAEYGSGKNGAKWHPSRAFHLLRGEAIAWLYTMILLDSVYMLETALKDSHNTLEKLTIEYEKKLSELQPVNYPPPKKCGPLYHCEQRPICHTDFKPHYGPDHMLLSSIVVGSTNWSYDPAYYSEWSMKYGYLDGKPDYTAKSGDSSQGELHLQIFINNTDFIWLCGHQKDSHKHSIVYVDLNVPLDRNMSEYVPSSTRKLWRQKKYIGFECKAVLGLPRGHHVVSVATNSSHMGHTSHLTHVIRWP